MEEKERYLKLEKVGRINPSTLDWVSSLRRGRWLFIGSQAPGKSFCSPPERNTVFRTVLRKQNVACLSAMSLETGFPGGASSKESTCQCRQPKRCRFKVKVKVTQSCLTLRPHGLWSPWNSPSQNTGVGSLSLLQGIFPTQGSNPGLLHCRQIFFYQPQHLCNYGANSTGHLRVPETKEAGVNSVFNSSHHKSAASAPHSSRLSEAFH